MLDDGTIEYEEGDPAEWFSTLKKKGGSLAKEEIADFTNDEWIRIGLPISVEKVLKKWASPQGNNLPHKDSLYPLIFSA